ncbi:MAG: hypothetical protein V4471_07295 [Pseudomonadota bacterium]
MNSELNNSQKKALDEITERITAAFNEKDKELLNELVIKIKDICTNISRHNKVSKVATGVSRVFTNNPKTTGLLTKTIAMGGAPVVAGSVGGAGGSLIGGFIQSGIEAGGSAAIDPVTKIPIIGDKIGEGLGSVFTTLGETFNGVGGIVISVILFCLLLKPAYKVSKWGIELLGSLTNKLLTSMFDIKDADKQLLELLQQETIARFFCASIMYIKKNRHLDNDSLFSKTKTKINKILGFSENREMAKAIKSKINHSNQATNDHAVLSKSLESAMHLSVPDKAALIEKLEPALEIIQKMDGKKGNVVLALGKTICTPRSAAQNNVSANTASTSGHRSYNISDTNSPEQATSKPGFLSSVKKTFAIKHKNTPKKETISSHVSTSVAQTQNPTFSQAHSAFSNTRTLRTAPIPPVMQTHVAQRSTNVSSLARQWGNKSGNPSHVNNASAFHRVPRPQTSAKRQAQLEGTSINTFRK